MITSRQQLQLHARTLQSRATAMTALLMTLFLLCIEHVRAFANQYHITAHDAMMLASAASSLTRKLSSTYIVSGDSLKTLPKSFSFVSSAGKASSSEGSSTRLKAWSIPAIALPSMPSMPTSKDVPIHALGSWYSEVDPTTKPPVYDDDYDSPYNFSSPTDDWPSLAADLDEVNKTAQPRMQRRGPLKVRGPLRVIRSVAGRVKDILVQ